MRHKRLILSLFTAALIAPIGLTGANSREARTTEMANTADTGISDTNLSGQGDAQQGKRIFNRCRACHSTTKTKRRRLGPDLQEIFGRKVGSSTDFPFSKALIEAEFTWSENELNQWLAKPSAYLPGNKMQFAGIKKAQDRKNLIAYLRAATVKQDQ